MFSEGFEDANANIAATLWPVWQNCTIVNTWAHKADIPGTVEQAGGDWALNLVGGLGIRTPVLPSTDHEWIHFALRANSIGQNPAEFSVRCYLGGVVGLYITFFINGTINARLGSGTILGTSVAINRLVDHFFWLRMKPQNVGGAVEVYMDGSAVPLLSFAGDTTSNAGNGFDQLGLERTSASAENPIIDDIVILTDAEKTTTMGGGTPTRELYIKRSFATGNGAVVELTPSAGANWQNVIGQPYSTATFNQSVVQNRFDLYTRPALNYSPDLIIAARGVNYAARDGVFTGVAAKLRSGVTTVTGTLKNTGASLQYSICDEYYINDPDTAALWTIGGWNAAQFGGELA